MTPLNPAHVPETGDPRWIIASKEKCSSSQRVALLDLLQLEGVQPADLFGDGYSSMPELSRWAAHWAIDLLESKRQARAVEQQRVEFEQRKEEQLKSMIADYFRAKHPSLRSQYRG